MVGLPKPSAARISLLDRLYARFANRRPFFYEGWGNTDAMAYLLSVRRPRSLYRGRPGPVVPRLIARRGWQGLLLREFAFESNYYFARTFRGVRIESRLDPGPARGRCLLVLPSPKHRGPIAIHFASTGDEGYGRRLRSMARPLARRGVASLILENPLYGTRRLPGRDERPPTVAEFLRMSRATQDEGIALADWLRAHGAGTVAFTGISMGGYMAIAAGARSGRPCPVASCIPSHSAGPVYTEGVLSRSVSWEVLEAGLGDWAARFDEAAWPGPFGRARAVLACLLSLGDVQNLPRLKRPEALTVVNALFDAYIPPGSQAAIQEAYPEGTFEGVPFGHVGSFLRASDRFVEAVVASIRSFDRIRG